MDARRPGRIETPPAPTVDAGCGGVEERDLVRGDPRQVDGAGHRYGTQHRQTGVPGGSSSGPRVATVGLHTGHSDVGGEGHERLGGQVDGDEIGSEGRRSHQLPRRVPVDPARRLGEHQPHGISPGVGGDGHVVDGSHTADLDPRHRRTAASSVRSLDGSGAVTRLSPTRMAS